MEVTVLGTNGAWPGRSRPTSGYLLRHDGFNLCVDLGSGTLAALQEHIAIADINGVVISHAHYDHFLDLYPLYVARYWHEDDLPAIPLVAPTGFFDFLLRLVHSQERKGNFGSVYEPNEVEPGADAEVGPFRIQTTLLPHWVPNIGTRISASGSVLTYTGDTGPSEEIERLARGADLLIAEASWQQAPEGIEPFHLTARQAGDHAQRAEARRLLLSHFWPTDDRNLSREQAAETYDGEMTVAEEGLRMEVGS